MSIGISLFILVALCPRERTSVSVCVMVPVVDKIVRVRINYGSATLSWFGRFSKQGDRETPPYACEGASTLEQPRPHDSVAVVPPHRVTPHGRLQTSAMTFRVCNIDSVTSYCSGAFVLFFPPNRAIGRLHPTHARATPPLSDRVAPIPCRRSPPRVTPHGRLCCSVTASYGHREPTNVYMLPLNQTAPCTELCVSYCKRDPEESCNVAYVSTQYA